MRLLAPGVVATLLAAAPLGAAPPADGPREAARAYRQSHERQILEEFKALLALPNLARSTLEIRRNAEHIAGLLERRGIRARLLDGAGGPPAVYGELVVPGAERTLAVYAHYDGQPVDPARWATPPWTPVLRDGPLERGAKQVPLEALPRAGDGEFRLYARSAGDDKAPVIALLAALDALHAAGRAPSVSLKLLFEGEEEAGSPHLRQVLEANRGLLRADLWLLCDGPVHQTRRPQLFFGARGVTGVEITMYGPLRTLHSGHYGNWAPNPALMLARLIASLRDDDGRILVPGFSDAVRPLTAAEQRALHEVPDVDVELRRELGLAWSEANDARLAERILLPALNVRGLAAGAVGERAANAIPTEARASLDFRLVPDQTPSGVRESVEAYLKAQGYSVVHAEPDLATRLASQKLVRLDWDEGGYPAARTSMELPAARALVSALEAPPGPKLVLMPTLGGSIPMYLFQQVLQAPVVGLPIANHDDNQHAANENLRLQNLWDGIEAYAALLAGLGPAWDGGAAAR
jgi:acetylornithine deacetylase/succinyl-diaminopimelate desuccinylase-like protein